jgi:hypothetical protein
VATSKRAAKRRRIGRRNAACNGASGARGSGRINAVRAGNREKVRSGRCRDAIHGVYGHGLGRGTDVEGMGAAIPDGIETP